MGIQLKSLQETCYKSNIKFLFATHLVLVTSTHLAVSVNEKVS